mmetsp:Transcript_12777/g.25239  ORF Transcript_12777/g.25239 Transcript_12777/m.25239 type:complete len:288 (-) Transcript_12777:1071-1934(-)
MKENSILGFTSVISSGDKNTHAPILRATEMAYCALLFWSPSPSAPSDQSTVRGATAEHNRRRKVASARPLSLRFRIRAGLGGDPASGFASCTFAFAQSTSVFSVTAPSVDSSFSMSRVNRRMSCHITARTSFLFPSQRSLPPMFTTTRSICLASVTTVLQLSTAWMRPFGFLWTLFQFTIPGWMRSMRRRMVKPSAKPKYKSFINTVPSSSLTPSRFKELIHIRNVRSSRVSPELSSTTSAAKLASSSSCSSIVTSARPGFALKICATIPRFSFELPETISFAFRNG